MPTTTDRRIADHGGAVRWRTTRLPNGRPVQVAVVRRQGRTIVLVRGRIGA